jgi:Flp pilus assembly protein TadG
MIEDTAVRLNFGNYSRTDGSQVAELAVALPLLMIVVIGITDFGSAFNLKQTLNSAAREGSRFASNQTMADVTNPTLPKSVDAIRQIIDNYLTAANVNDCGLATTVPQQSGLIWTFAASTGCAGNETFTLTIDRGTTFQTGSTRPVTIEATHVHLSYPFQWRFGKLMSLVVPNTNYAKGMTLVTSDAITANLN